MLNFNSIVSQYPELTHLPGKEQFFIREYLQYKILELIYQSPLSNDLTFLGGTAIRIIHGNTRFSEDLDFDNHKITEEQFKELMNHLQKKLELQGYSIEIKIVSKSALRCYFKFIGLMYQYELSTNSKEKLVIQIDTVPQHFSYNHDLKLLNKFDVFTQVPVVPIDILLSQKIYAAFNRPRAKGRDFFDISYLWSLTQPNYDYLEQKIKISTPSDLKEWLLGNCTKLNFFQLAKDVEPFLFNPSDNKRVLLFPEFVKQL